MEQFAKETLPVSLEAEMRHSYLDYAMSVIVGRALPDVRDGLKPVHRRVLFAMHEANIVWNRPYVKCARVVGDVHGQIPPARRHGDLRRAGPDGAGLLAALSADRRPGQLRLGRRRQRRRRCATPSAGSSGSPTSCWPTSTRKPSISSRTTTARSRSRRPAVAAAEPAGQRLVGHRRRHGDQHPAAQPDRDRSTRCLALLGKPGAHASTS